MRTTEISGNQAGSQGIRNAAVSVDDITDENN